MGAEDVIAGIFSIGYFVLRTAMFSFREAFSFFKVLTTPCRELFSFCRVFTVSRRGTIFVF
jgi:hypothetical protein